MLKFFDVRGIRSGDIDDVIIASVVPSVPIKNNYRIKKEVGVDRLVNAFCAHKTYKRPLIVVDFGTAITFDVVSKEGEYEGVKSLRCEASQG